MIVLLGTDYNEYGEVGSASNIGMRRGESIVVNTLEVSYTVPSHLGVQRTKVAYVCVPHCGLKNC